MNLRAAPAPSANSVCRVVSAFQITLSNGCIASDPVLEQGRCYGNTNSASGRKLSESCVETRLRRDARLERSFLQINMLHSVDGVSEKASSQPLKFLGGIGGEEFQSRYGTTFLCIERRFHKLSKMFRDGPGSGLRRIHNADMPWCYALKQRLEQRVMRATQYQCVGVVEAIRERLREIDACDLLC